MSAQPQWHTLDVDAVLAAVASQKSMFVFHVLSLNWPGLVDAATRALEQSTMTERVGDAPTS
jgi:hypothetical protein